MKKTNKTFKRFAAITSASLLAACAVMPAVSSALIGTGTGSISITDTSGATHDTLAAYQIFTAGVTQDGKLNITGWGDGVNLTTLKNALTADDCIFKEIFSGLTFSNDEADNALSAQAVSDAIATITEPTKQEELARIIVNSVNPLNGVEAEANTGNTVIENLPTGYYVIRDINAASKDDYLSYTLGILTVLAGETTTATTKIDFPSFDKQIGDINDSTETAYTYGEEADHDMGDDVPFRLIGTVPSNIDKYDTYKMIFHDNLQKDVFDLNESSFTVKYYSTEDEIGVDGKGTDVTGSFTPSTTGLSDNSKFSGANEGEKTEDFTVSCEDITAISGVSAGGYFVVDYTAKLTTNANLGETGNWNSAYLEYSNNPNVSGEGDSHATTSGPEDSVVAFTYQTIVDKIDAITKQPLEGAEFTLVKNLADGSTKEIGVFEAEAGTRFVFQGLDDGEYVLTESVTPTNYNGIKPITFTIKSEKSDEALKSLSAATTEGTQQAANFSTGKVYTLTTDEDGNNIASVIEGAANNGSVITVIENSKGTSLPGTGGIGTTIFYLGGGAMAAIGGVYLISKRRMKKSEE